MTEIQLAAVRTKTRLRLLFTGIHLALYFSFGLNWTHWGDVLRNQLGSTQVTASLLMFVLLIVTFIVLETVFLVISRGGRS